MDQQQQLPVLLPRGDGPSTVKPLCALKWFDSARKLSNTVLSVSSLRCCRRSVSCACGWTRRRKPTPCWLLRDKPLPLHCTLGGFAAPIITATDGPVSDPPSQPDALYFASQVVMDGWRF